MKKIRIFPLVLLFALLLGVMSPCAYALEAPQLNGKAAVLVDLDSGRVLYGQNMDEERAPASLTKVMTVLLALEALDSGRVTLDEMITAQDDCQQGMEDDSSTSGITPGVVISMKSWSIMAFRRAAMTFERRMMFFLTSGFLRSRYLYLRRVISSASRLLFISKGSSL